MNNPSQRISENIYNDNYDKIEDKYSEIIQNGLPKTKNPKNVAIVGAGISGLLSALLLSEAGHKVTIFEASNRIGGRIKTIREPFTDGNYAEVGAMRLPSFYKLTLQIIKQLNLKTNQFINSNPEGLDFVYVNGILQNKKQYEITKAKGLNLPLLDTEINMTADELLAEATDKISKYVAKDHLEDFKHNRWKEVVKKYGKMSVREYLKTTTFYSEAAIEFIELFKGLESRSDQSIVQQLVEINDHAPNVQYFEITGGMDKLPLSIADKLKDINVDIHKNKRLVSIDQNDRQVELTFIKDNEKSIKPQNISKVFDQVITSIPFSGFRYVNIKPMLSHKKRKVIRELHYDSSTKIVMQFKERFWETRDGIFGGNSTTDLPSRFVYYPSHGYSSKTGVIITSYTWGDPARTWDSLTFDEQIRNSLNDIAAIHGEYVKDLFQIGYVQSWQKDPYAYGEAAMFYPGQLKELHPFVSKKEGRIHFAGEHTSLKHAWIEGAVESAIRVALEI